MTFPRPKVTSSGRNRPHSSMSVRIELMDEAKQLVSRFVNELWNERRLDVADAIFSKDCVTHQLRSGDPDNPVPRGPETIKEHIAVKGIG
jgi:hypothetical protein